MKKNLFLTFCFSFIPGAGQMYQAYMKRGLSIMIIFAIFVALSAVTGSAIFAIPLPVIFAYSFFDTYNLRSKIETENQEKDDYIIKEFNEIKFLNSIKKGNNVIGVILIAIGIYILFDSVISNIAYRLDLYFLTDIINIVMRYLPATIIAALSIFVGVKFVSKNK